MFVWSVRASTLKFTAVLIASAAAIAALAVFLPKYDMRAQTASAVVTDGKVAGEDGIRGFLSQYGWEASELVDRAEVTVPAQFDPVYEEYNTLQKKQGYDLSGYKKKTVSRYTFKIENYEGYGGTVLADVLVYKNRVIGGDVCSADVNGFVHGFSRDVTLP
ncbi:MAG: DUF4830 domain-containing protein [Clostridia bacterium]|nr:DUF4830 domain-containing protein [Clostridia bacterium]